MFKISIKSKIPAIAFLFLLCSFRPGNTRFVFAQSEALNPSQRLEQERITNETEKTLKVIFGSIDNLKERLANKEDELLEAKTADQRTRIAEEIKKLDTRLTLIQKDFEEIATGVNLDVIAEEAKKQFDLQEEIKDLLGPIIQEIRRITAHPREIEKLRTQVDFYQKRKPVLENGIKNLQRLIEKTEDPEIKEQLLLLEKKWTNQFKHIDNQLIIAQYHLAERLKGKKSFLESAQKMFRLFFKSRGKNLSIALLAFAIIWLSFHFLYQFVEGIIYKKKKTKTRSFYGRLINVVYFIFTFVGSMGAMLFVLYIYGDWVLLGIVLIFLIGIAWAARQTIPKFLSQIKLLLNLGSVKEDERLIYNGLPWKVQSLSLSTKIINPRLKGGLMRLRLTDLLNLQSRPCDPDESWFPCKENDWVILADNTYGKIVSQTPEFVELALLGGSVKTYPTLGFLNQNPNNLSKNFRISTIIEIDYRHQAIITHEIPEKLKEMLIVGLSEEGYRDTVLHLDVQFKNAGPSSLDLEIMADFSGDVAQDYFSLVKSLQRIAVEACNKYNWTIPFTQITVHNAT